MYTEKKKMLIELSKIQIDSISGGTVIVPDPKAPADPIQPFNPRWDRWPPFPGFFPIIPRPPGDQPIIWPGYPLL
jgi:hypothetical protein